MDARRHPHLRRKRVHGVYVEQGPENNQVAEAFAVKDGKYVYVGDKKGAEQYIVNGKTEVIDYTGKGLVMPGCGNGHAHYSMAYALRVAGTTVGGNASPEKFLTEILPAAVKKAKEAGATSVFGFGWRLLDFQDNMPTRQQMDAICITLQTKKVIRHWSIPSCW